MPAYRYSPYQPYQSRSDDTIAELMARRGDIIARGTEQQAALWGNALGQAGQAAAGVIQQHSERKNAERRQQALDQALKGWDGQDSNKLFMNLASVIGPEAGMRVAQGVLSLRASQTKAEPD